MAAPKKKSNHHKQKTVSFRLPDDLMAKLRDLAQKNRRTLSGELQLAIEHHLQNNCDANSASPTDRSDGASESFNTI